MEPLAVDVALLATDESDAQAALDLLTQWDARLCALGRVPRLYASGVRYAREPEMIAARSLPRVRTPWGRAERFDDARVVLSRGVGDCDDLAAWRAGELLAAGIPARALLVSAGEGYHCIVRTPWGDEDPSRVLGMGST